MNYTFLGIVVAMVVLVLVLSVGLLAQPTGFEQTFNRALGLLQDGRAAEALTLLDERPSPRQADYHALRGAVLNALGRQPDAAEALRRAVALAPGNPDTLYDLMLTLARIDGTSAELSKLAGQGRRRFPRVGKMHAAAGMVAYAGGRNSEAVRAYESAVKLEPDAADFQAALGDVRDATGDLEGAERAFAESVRLDPSAPEVWVKYGRNLLKRDKPDKAKAAFARAVTLDASHADAHFQLGKLAASGGAHDDAVAHYRAAVKAAPALKEAWYQLGVSLRRAGRERESAEALAEYRRLQ